MTTNTVRRAFNRVGVGDVLAFTGGGTAEVVGIGPEYGVRTRAYHEVTLRGPDGQTRTEVFARMSWWDVVAP